ncbi:hypothetical protein GGR56DRAFT_641574 [Xylariaceae sp. FL0804]|nr:hypothetical protein GGR56DRAFT_641574 [Xylariaceae sp. FL0804]
MGLLLHLVFYVASRALRGGEGCPGGKDGYLNERGTVKRRIQFRAQDTRAVVWFMYCLLVACQQRRPGRAFGGQDVGRWRTQRIHSLRKHLACVCYLPPCRQCQIALL